MFGKHFASTYTGSMYGAGADVFAVWGYVIANTWDSQVELNPVMLAGILGMTPEAVEKAIEYLCAPDLKSRNKVENGCRLLREGEYAYYVPTHSIYRSILHEEDRRQYNKNKQRESRARRRAIAEEKTVNNRVNDKSNGRTGQDVSIRQSTMSAQAEAETERESKAAVVGVSTVGKTPPPPPPANDSKVQTPEQSKARLKKLLADYGFRNSPTDVDEWHGGMVQVGEVRSLDEAKEFLKWLRHEVKQGAVIDHWRHASLLAKEWRERKPEKWVKKATA